MPTTISGSNGLTVPQGAVYNGIASGTAQASTSGTSIDFTGIPSWVKRITVMFQGVSTSGTSAILVQLGVGGTPVTSGYNSTAMNQSGAATLSSTAGFLLTPAVTATDTESGQMIISCISTNNYVASSMVKASTSVTCDAAGDGSIGGVANMVRITTVGGTDTFDAGSINILYE